MTKQPNLSSVMKEFDEKFYRIDVNECEYDENGEPDNKVIINKDNMVRYGLDTVRDFISSSLRKLVEEIRKEIKNMPIETVGNSAKTVIQIEKLLDKKIKEVLKQLNIRR